MAITKEFRIQLNNKQVYYPGDLLKGQVILNLKKPIEVQYISVTFQGIVEGVDNKVSLINKTEWLAQPNNGQKYTVLDNNQQHVFNFEFDIPKNQLLPSSFEISRVGRVAYSLTATHKKPRFKLSPTLPSVIEHVHIMDSIDVSLTDYRIPVKMKNDLGFIRGDKLTQWNSSIPKSAFIRGDTVTFECNINNFPIMERQKAIKVSLIRQVHRTSTAKVIECKVLSSKTIDLHVTNVSPVSQSTVISFNIPHNTPPSVFPNTGRTLSISYLIQAELNMKGIKSAVKLKSSYTQEILIVVGTIQSIPSNNYAPSVSGRASVVSNQSHVSLQSLAMESNSHILLPLSSNQSSRSSIRSLDMTDRRSSSTNLMRRQQQRFPSMHADVKPLARLDETEELGPSRSYLPPHGKKTYISSSLKPSEILNKPAESPTSLNKTSVPSTPLTTSSYQEAFDDYLPTTPLGKLPYENSTKPTGHNSATAKNSSPPITNRSFSPLPPLPVENEPIYHIRNSTHRQGANRPLFLPPNSFDQRDHYITSSPHEIGPDDIINKQARPIMRPNANYNTEAAAAAAAAATAIRQSQPGTPVPSLLYRQDTVSTASSAGLVDPPIHGDKTIFH